MTRLQLFQRKNSMMFANFLSNFIGVFISEAILFRAEGLPAMDIWQHPLPYWIDLLFTPFAFCFVAVATVRYERPIRRCMNLMYRQAPIPPNLEADARRRLLNSPFVLIGMGFSMWILAAAIYPTLHWVYGTESSMVERALIQALSTGFITATIAFFLLEHILQKRLVPFFFPNGGLTTIPRTLRIRIQTRLVALLFACNLIPLASIMLILQRITRGEADLDATIRLLRSAIFTNAVMFIGVGIFLTTMLSRNLSIPFKEIVQTLRWVRNGRFDKKIQVTTNDEIGYTGDVINEMTQGLIERERMKQSLSLAMEVQQNLLPTRDPEIEGFDIAGASMYCEETGGDYYDYLFSRETGQKLLAVVGDVSDHGVQAALLMTTARAFLRQRISRSGELDQVVTDINRQLSRDVKDSGRFMTLLLCEFDRANQSIQWVNAGHDPAMHYDRERDTFEDLPGRALPLGVSETAVYRKSQKMMVPGQIVIMGTDGIWEARNANGEMFGKERFKAIIRAHAEQPAKAITEAVIQAVNGFCHPLKNSDDLTLVVTKFTGMQN